MRQGLAIFHTTGAKFAIPSFLCDLAEAHERAGRVEEGLALVTEALGMITKTGEHVSEAELYRIKGELMLQKFRVSSSEFQGEQNPRSKVQGPRSSKTKSQILNPKSQEEAEACFLKAIKIARGQQAKSLELRATMSLARLWQRQGKHHTARNTLSEIYSWFTEGFDTADLKDAKVLLEELH